MSEDPRDQLRGPRQTNSEGIGSAGRGQKNATGRSDGGTLALIVVAALILASLGLFAAATLGLMWRLFQFSAGLI